MHWRDERDLLKPRLLLLQRLAGAVFRPMPLVSHDEFYHLFRRLDCHKPVLEPKAIEEMLGCRQQIVINHHALDESGKSSVFRRQARSTSRGPVRGSSMRLCWRTAL